MRGFQDARQPAEIQKAQTDRQCPAIPGGHSIPQDRDGPGRDRRILRREVEDGALLARIPEPGAEELVLALDPDAGDQGNLAEGGRLWDLLPRWDWRMPGPGKAIVFEGPPLAADRVMLGTGSADLWLRSPVADADLEITLSEIRPDGQEIFVQAGWLRASLRGLAPTATELWPELTFQERDHAPLVPGQWTSVRVPIAGFGHAFRAGSRVRVSVDTPGGGNAEWRFALT
ncbi:MAG: hypothetical protein HYZ03_10015, partial [candidate division NC10 bacterium]|nr:hypothetical protein [candidate division NC10 bacterium]